MISEKDVLRMTTARLYFIFIPMRYPAFSTCDFADYNRNTSFRERSDGGEVFFSSGWGEFVDSGHGGYYPVNTVFKRLG